MEAARQRDAGLLDPAHRMGDLLEAHVPRRVTLAVGDQNSRVSPLLCHPLFVHPEEVPRIAREQDPPVGCSISQVFFILNTSGSQPPSGRGHRALPDERDQSAHLSPRHRRDTAAWMAGLGRIEKPRLVQPLSFRLLFFTNTFPILLTVGESLVYRF